MKKTHYTQYAILTVFDFMGRSGMDKEERRQRRAENALGALAAGVSVDESVRRLAEVYRKPLEYRGNRKLFDDGMAKRLAKENLFASGKAVKDPYTGKKLFLRKQEAKLAYGKKWTEHLAEADHVEPVHRIFEAHKDDAWVTNSDIKDAVNSPENLKAISRKLNNNSRNFWNKKTISGCLLWTGCLHKTSWIKSHQSHRCRYFPALSAPVSLAEPT